MRVTDGIEWSINDRFCCFKVYTRACQSKLMISRLYCNVILAGEFEKRYSPIMTWWHDWMNGFYKHGIKLFSMLPISLFLLPLSSNSPLIEFLRMLSSSDLAHSQLSDFEPNCYYVAHFLFTLNTNTTHKIEVNHTPFSFSFSIR